MNYTKHNFEKKTIIDEDDRFMLYAWNISTVVRIMRYQVIV